MDKISILLQDKHTIEELAKDPEVQIRIKDAIVEGIGRRAAKLINSSYAIKEAVSQSSDAIKDSIEKELLTKDGWRKTLKDNYADIIRKQVDLEVRHIVSDEVASHLKTIQDDIAKRIEAYKQRVTSLLDGYDLEKVITEQATLEIRRRLDKK